jgi:hypothetical protein
MNVGTYLIMFCESNRINQGRMRFQRLHTVFEFGAHFDMFGERGPDLLDLVLQRLETVYL